LWGPGLIFYFVRSSNAVLIFVVDLFAFWSVMFCCVITLVPYVVEAFGDAAPDLDCQSGRLFFVDFVFCEEVCEAAREPGVPRCSRSAACFFWTDAQRTEAGDKKEVTAAGQRF
jgi:hypothetical protein